MKYLSMFLMFYYCVTTNLPAQNNYDITIRNLRSEKALLQNEASRTVGLRKYEIQDRIQAIDAQELEIERIRAEAMKASAPRINKTQNINSHNRVVPAATPQKNWEEVEAPNVIVKGTMQQNGKWVALVNHGQLVTVGQQFTTRYKGADLSWIATSIDGSGAKFQKVSASQEGKTPTPDVAERLKKLEELKTQGLVSEQEYAAQRKKIIGAL